MTIEAVAFDKDGVIFDSERVYARGLEQAAAEFGVALPADTHGRLTGVSADQSYAVLREYFGERTESFIEEHWLPLVYHLLETEDLPFIPGVESLIESLHAQGYPLALVTNDFQENLLRDVNYTRPDLLQYFSVVITRDDVKDPKPHPEPYQRAAALLGVATEQLLVIEDSDTGAEAALAAGAQVLLLAHGRKVAPEMQARLRRVIASHHEVIRELGA